MKNNKAENTVSNFYKSGWDQKNGSTEDAKRWEDLRKYSRDYVSKCRLRIFKYIPKKGESILDMASGPIQYKEYLKYSCNFKKRYCVDLSLKALNEAKRKIKNHGVFLHGSFFDLEFENNFFDCSLSLHTLYHIDKNKQEEAVRKLLKITKKGAPLIIIYSNPNTLISKILIPLIKVRNIFKKFKKTNSYQLLYFYAHPLEWWDRFNYDAYIEKRPWRSFESNHQKFLFPNNIIGKFMLDILFKLEDKFPKFFVNNFQYPMLILTKK